MTFTTVRPLANRLEDFTAGRLRGFCLNHNTQYVEKDFIDAKANGANVLRVPLHWKGDTQPDLTAVRQALDMGAKYEMRVIVVLCPLGPDYWADPAAQQGLVSVWTWIALQIRNYPALQAYDIVNEPVGKRNDREMKTAWLAIAQVISTALRAADPKTPIMIEPCWWGQAGSFWQTLPVKINGLVYSFHWYEPGAYTHQGLNGYTAPTPLPTEDWSGKMIEAVKFAKLYNVPMFVGEFSVVNGAPNAVEWIKHALELFKTYGWGWTYHVWRGWSGWDSEIAPGTTVRASTAPIITELRKSMQQS